MQVVLKWNILASAQKFHDTENDREKSGQLARSPAASYTRRWFSSEVFTAFQPHDNEESGQLARFPA